MRRKKLVIPIIAILFLLTIINPLVLGLSITKSKIVISENVEYKKDGNTFYVGGIGPNNYTNISYAVKDASNGDTIFVYSGTYYEYIRIFKSLKLIGENKENTIINCLNKMDVIKISSDNVTIQGFNIKDAGENFWQRIDAGIEISKNSNDILIQDNIISEGYCGVLIQGSNNVSIKNNIFYDNNGPCIWLSGKGENNSVSNNIIKKETNKNGGGIWIEKFSSNNTIKNNNFTNTGIFFFGNKIEHFTQKIEGNTVNNKQLLYMKNQKNIKIPENTLNIILVNCSNIKINNINSRNVEAGVLAAFSSNITISNSNFSNSNAGISLVYSNKCTIKNNNITNIGDGIKLSYSNINQIKNNLLNVNRLGMEIIHSYENHITKNTISTNYSLRNIELLSSYDNYIYQNNFYVYKKYMNIYYYIAVDTGYNYWDNGSIGNYWWDYEERYLDTKDDGIIYEKPYEIVPGNNKDNYPLLKPVDINSNPPTKPKIINGPKYGGKKTDLYYNTSSIDSDDNEIYYLFDWGDNTNSGWIGPVDSGSIISVNKTWEKIGLFKIRVKAKDVYGFESNWSDPLRVIMPKHKQISKSIFFDFLNNFLNIIFKTKNTFL